MHCCRRRSARAAAMRAAVHTPRPSPAGRPPSTAARPAAPPASRRWRSCCRSSRCRSTPPVARGAPGRSSADRPGSLHRLRALPAGLPGRRHRRRAALPAHGVWSATAMAASYASPACPVDCITMPPRAGRPSPARHRRPKTAAATTRTGRACKPPRTSVRNCLPTASAARADRHDAAAGPSDLQPPARRQPSSAQSSCCSIRHSNC